MNGPIRFVNPEIVYAWSCPDCRVANYSKPDSKVYRIDPETRTLVEDVDLSADNTLCISMPNEVTCSWCNAIFQTPNPELPPPPSEFKYDEAEEGDPF